MVALITVLASSAEDSGGWGFLVILATVVAIVLVVGAVWTFAARRGSRTPERATHDHDPGVRGS
jgi:hypothetical protein